MSNRLPILTDDEVRRGATSDEPGFGALSTSKGLLPLKALAVQTRIDGLVARTRLTQTFVNSLDEPLEATYIFPLPDRAAVTHFRMEVAGRLVEGVLKERGEARREYDQALVAGRRAGIAEEERSGVFTLRVGNLMPGETASVRLTLTGPLTFDAGEATFRFPLVVAPRYIPGVPLPGASVGAGVEPDTDAVPDASRITPPVLLPGFPSPVRLSLSVELHSAGLPLADVCSSLPALVKADDRGVCHIVAEPGQRLDRDFILRFRVGSEAVRTSLVLQPDGPGSKEGTFLLTVVPPCSHHAPRDEKSITRSVMTTSKPRDIVFILDRSGSMAGWKITAARRALARMVDTLTDQDRFTVYAFDDSIDAPPSFKGTGLVPATNRNRFRAVEFLARIESRGGTNIALPLEYALDWLVHGEAGRDRSIVLVTDGQVGNEDQVLHRLGKRAEAVRLFALGIDQAVNEGFLKRLAALGGGSCEMIESEDRLDEVMDGIHRRIDTPLLTDLRLEPAGLDIERATVVPGRLPDLFPGAPLFLLGRYHGSGRGSLLVQAQGPAGPWSQNVTATLGEDSAVTSIWARGQVRELEDRYAIGRGDKNLLMKQIVNTSLRFGVLCRFTAFVAVDLKEIVNPSGLVQRVTQPVESAAGWAMLGTVALQAPPPPACAAPAPPSAELAPVNECLRKIRKAVESTVKPGPDMVTMGKLPQTPRAKMAIAWAIEEARHHDHIGPEHLLLGLLRVPEGLAAQVLMNQGLKLADVRQEVARLLGQPLAPPESDCTAPDPSLSYARFTEQARRVMQLANQEAQRFNHEYIGTEHILLGLIREGSGIAARILGNLDASAIGQASAESEPLSPFRKQALDLLERLRRTSGAEAAERLQELSRLAVQLVALLEGARLAAIPEQDTQPLQGLLQELRRLLARPQLTAAEIAEMCRRAERMLEEFAAPGVPASAGRREEFWK